MHLRTEIIHGFLSTNEVANEPDICCGVELQNVKIDTAVDFSWRRFICLSRIDCQNECLAGHGDCVKKEVRIDGPPAARHGDIYSAVSQLKFFVIE